MKDNATSMTNEELYKKYYKLVCYYIHHWGSKPYNYMEYFDDINSQVLIRLFTIPIYGTRRHSKDFVSQVIRSAISTEYRKIRAQCDNELSFRTYKDDDGHDIIDHPTSYIDESYKSAELQLTIAKAYSDLNIDEKIVFSAWMQSRYKKQQCAVHEVAKLIYKSPVETKIILNEVLNKMKNIIRG